MNATSETECYVAFLDILGFSAIVEGNTTEYLESYFDGFREKITHAFSNGYILSNRGEKKSIAPNIKQATVNWLLVSDSIFIWTNDSSTESFKSIVTAVRNLLAFSIIGRIPLRGAISVGPVKPVLNKWSSQTHGFEHSLLGRAVVDVVKAEREQQWCGCEITQNAIEFYKKNCSDSESLIEKEWILPYLIPKKMGRFDGYVIDWLNHHEVGIDAKTVGNAFAHSLSKIPDSDEWEKIQVKLKNTLEFVQSIKSTGS
jgi:hypothetical protein